MAASTWASKRLIYRGVETTDQDFIYEAVVTSPEGFFNQTAILPVPYTQDAAKITVEMVKKSYMSALICLPATASPAEGQEPGAKKAAPIPVGWISLQGAAPVRQHHRSVSIAVQIIKTHQGKGYGSEAILWILEWAFMDANLHRVGIGAYEWNQGALKLYRKLGFKDEGVERESLWHRGRYWNAEKLGMLEHEWRELYGNKQQAREVAPVDAAKELGLR